MESSPSSGGGLGAPRERLRKWPVPSSETVVDGEVKIK